MGIYFEKHNVEIQAFLWLFLSYRQSLNGAKLPLNHRPKQLINTKIKKTRCYEERKILPAPLHRGG